MLESLRVVARLKLAPARRPWHAAAAIVGAGAWTAGPAVVAAAVAVLALAAVWPPLPGVLSSAIFVIVTVAVLLAPPPVHLVTAVAVAGGRGGGLYYEPALAPSRYFTRPLYATRRGGSVRPMDKSHGQISWDPWTDLVGPMDKLQLESAASRDVRRLKLLLPGAHPRTAWPE